MFQVQAESSAGISSTFDISSGFPVGGSASAPMYVIHISCCSAVDAFHVDVSVTLTVPELIPQATISFHVSLIIVAVNDSSE